MARYIQVSFTALAYNLCCYQDGTGSRLQYGTETVTRIRVSGQSCSVFLSWQGVDEMAL